MRVLVISFTSLLQAHYRRKVDALAKLPGVEVEVVVPPFWRELWRGKPVLLETPESTAVPMRITPALFSGNLHLALFREQLVRVIRRFRPDVLDVENEPFNLGAFQITTLRRVIRPTPALVMHASQNVLKRYPPPFNLIEKLVLKDADGFLARTEDAKRVLVTRGVPESRIDVVPHGVDTEAFRPLSPGERAAERDRLGIKGFTVGFVGAITKQKGLETLLGALERAPMLRACIVGEGPHSAALRSTIDAMKLNDRVILRPAAPHAEVAKIMAAVDAYVLPSITLPGVVERFGRVLIEAMSCETPVVGSSCGEIPRVLGEAGIVFPEGDSVALAAALEKLQNDPDHHRRVAVAGRLRVLERFSWDVIAAQTKHRYDLALAHRRGR